MKQSLSRLWYLVAVALFAIGAGYGAHSCAGAWSTFQDMPRAVMPGTATLHLAAGDHTAYVESGAVIDGVVYRAAPGTLQCSLVAADGAAARLLPMSGSVSYDINGVHGQGLFSVEVPRTGEYVIDCDGDDDNRVVIAIGDGLVGAVLIGVGSIIAGFMAAIGAVLVVHLQRRRARIEAVPVASIGRL
jgi:hypothetical protein